MWLARWSHCLKRCTQMSVCAVSPMWRRPELQVTSLLMGSHPQRKEDEENTISEADKLCTISATMQRMVASHRRLSANMLGTIAGPQDNIVLAMMGAACETTSRSQTWCRVGEAGTERQLNCSDGVP